MAQKSIFFRHQILNNPNTLLYSASDLNSQPVKLDLSGNNPTYNFRV